MFQPRPKEKQQQDESVRAAGRGKILPGRENQQHEAGEREGGISEEQKEVLQSCDTECDGRTIKAGDIIGASSGGPFNTIDKVFGRHLRVTSGIVLAREGQNFNIWEGLLWLK